MNICELSDRDLVIECVNELEALMKEMLQAYLTGPIGDIEYLTHTNAQVIKMARINNRIRGYEQAVLEKMAAVRNLFCHYNGLSFDSPEVVDLMSAIPSLMKIEQVTKDRVVFVMAYRKLAREFLIRLYRVGGVG